MGELFSYSIYAGIFLIALYLPYKWALAGEAQHSANRAILLGIYLTALVAMPLTVAVKGWLAAPVPTAIPAAWVEMPVTVGVADDDVSVTVADVLLWVYMLGMLAGGLHTLCVWVRLARIVRTGEKRPCGRFTLVLTDRDGIAPFSWMRYIVMSRADYAEAGEMILCHETRHLRLGHPLDLLLAQAVAIIEWWNPAAWLMREELKAVHEYQADRAVLCSGVNARQYQLLLIKKAVGARFPSLANSLNHSKLKKRITMMYSQKKSGSRAMRVLAMVPALAAAVLIGQIPAVASAIDGAAEATLSTPAAVTVGKVTTNSSVVQAPVADSEESSEPQAAQVQPQFPGGIEAMLDYLHDNLRYPEKAEKAGIEGRVVVKFVIDKNGKASDPTIIRSVDPELDAEAMRVVSSMPDFIPGTVDGKPVAVYYTLPVNFRLPGKGTQSQPSKPSKSTSAQSEASTATATKSQPTFAVVTGEGNVTVTTTDGKREITLNGKPVNEADLETSGVGVIAIGGGQPALNSLKDAIYRVDGKEVSLEDLNAVSPGDIASMTIDKQGDNPVISITTKHAN